MTAVVARNSRRRIVMTTVVKSRGTVCVDEKRKTEHTDVPNALDTKHAEEHTRRLRTQVLPCRTSRCWPVRRQSHPTALTTVKLSATPPVGERLPPAALCFGVLLWCSRLLAPKTTSFA